MTKQEKIYRIFMTSMIVIIAGLLLATGIIALQKSIKVKMGINMLPSVNVEIYVKNDTYTEYELLFRNYVIDEENGIFAKTDYCVLSTGTLQLNDTFFERYDNNFTLKIYNNSGFDILTTITGRATVNVEGGVIEGVEPEITPNEASIYNKASEEFVVTCEPLLSQETILEIVMVKEAAWDGTVATQFAGGTGTEEDPFLISNGSELAYITKYHRTDDGYTITTTEGVYYQLTKDIKLNDEKFTNLGNGFVEVTDGVNVGYLGDGYMGLSTAGSWYIKNDDETFTKLATQPTAKTSTDVPYGYINYGENGVLYKWQSIFKDLSSGASTVDVNGFKASFDGCGRDIIGLYGAPLFGYIGGQGNIKNLVFTHTYATSPLAHLTGTAVIENCYNSETVTAFNAGFVDELLYRTNIINCHNAGYVIGTTGIMAGGIARTKSTNAPAYIKNCSNSGVVYSVDSYAGGILAASTTGSASQDGYFTIDSCYNTGTVYGTTAGGIVGVGALESEYINCCNLGTVQGENAGGIIGKYIGFAIVNCFSVGSVLGETYGGGIVGLEDSSSNGYGIINCYSYSLMTEDYKVSGALFGKCKRTLSSYNQLASRNIINVYYVPDVSNRGAVAGITSTMWAPIILRDNDSITSCLSNMNTWISENDAEGKYCSWKIVEGVNYELPIFDWQ